MKIYNEKNEPKEYEVGTLVDRIFTVLDLMHIKKIRFYADLKLSRTTILNWKRGAIPASDTLLNICNYLDVNPFWLLYGIASIKDKCDPDSPTNQVIRIKNRLEKITNKQPKDIDFYMPLKDIISPILLTKWKYGVQIPTLEQLERIAANLNMNILYLLNGTGKESESDDSLYINNTQPYALNRVSLKYYEFLNEDNKNTADTVIMNAYYKQLYEREHHQDPDEILTNEDVYANPNSGFDAGED